MIEAAIYAILMAAAGVTAIVGSRIYPVLMPETIVVNGVSGPVPYPALSYFTVDADEVHTLDRTAGLVRQRIQVDAWGNTYSDVKTVMKAVRTAMEATFGTISTPLGNVVVNGILRDNERDLYEKATRTYHCAGDFMVIYNE